MEWGFLRRLVIGAALSVAAIPCHAADQAYDKRIAFLVGLGKYEGGAGKGIFRDLPIRNDLEKLAEALKHVGFDSVEIYSDIEPPADSSNEYLSLLQPGSPPGTRVSPLDIDNQIESRLNALDGDGRTLLLVYFTGHGGLLSSSDRVLATPNSQLNSPTSFVRVRRLLNRMAQTPASVDKVLIVDACADLIDSKPRPPEAYASLADEELPVYFFSSSMGEPSFVDSSNQTSVFTHYLVQALMRPRELGLVNSDGAIASEKIRDYLLSAVPGHRSLELKRTAGTAGKTEKSKAQHPFASGRQRIVFGREPDLLPPPGANATEAEREAYFRGLQKVFYGRGQ